MSKELQERSMFLFGARQTGKTSYITRQMKDMIPICLEDGQENVYSILWYGLKSKIWITLWNIFSEQGFFHRCIFPPDRGSYLQVTGLVIF